MLLRSHYVFVANSSTCLIILNHVQRNCELACFTENTCLCFLLFAFYSCWVRFLTLSCCPQVMQPKPGNASLKWVAVASFVRFVPSIDAEIVFSLLWCWMDVDDGTFFRAKTGWRVSRQQQQQYSFTLGFGFLLRSLWPEQFCFEQQLVR